TSQRWSDNALLRLPARSHGAGDREGWKPGSFREELRSGARGPDLGGRRALLDGPCADHPRAGSESAIPDRRDGPAAQRSPSALKLIRGRLIALPPRVMSASIPMRRELPRAAGVA